jgi:hypothetical protein
VLLVEWGIGRGGGDDPVTFHHQALVIFLNAKWPWTRARRIMGSIVEDSRFRGLGTGGLDFESSIAVDAAARVVA